MVNPTAAGKVSLYFIRKLPLPVSPKVPTVVFLVRNVAITSIPRVRMLPIFCNCALIREIRPLGVRVIAAQLNGSPLKAQRLSVSDASTGAIALSTLMS